MAYTDDQLDALAESEYEKEKGQISRKLTREHELMLQRYGDC